MANFALPKRQPSAGDTANALAADKRPLSHCAPMLAFEVDRPCGRRLIAGGADALSLGQVRLKASHLNEQ